jgi:hypothetical protein
MLRHSVCSPKNLTPGPIDVWMNLDAIAPNDLWYLVGLIATDGCISSDGRHVSITSADRSHLEAIRRTLMLANTIGRKKRSGFGTGMGYRLQLGSAAFVRALVTRGLTPRKSLTIGPLKVPDDGLVDFLRGVIDGDGSLCTWIHSGNGIRQWALRIFTASPPFAFWLRSRIEHHFQIKGSIQIRREGRTHPIFVVKFGKLAMKVVLRACYYPGSLALERKRLLALECLRSADGHRWYRDVIPRPG